MRLGTARLPADGGSRMGLPDPASQSLQASAFSVNGVKKSAMINVVPLNFIKVSPESLAPLSTPCRVPRKRCPDGSSATAPTLQFPPPSVAAAAVDQEPLAVIGTDANWVGMA